LQQFLADMAAAGKYFQMESRFSCFLSAMGTNPKNLITLCLVFFLCCPLFGVTGSRPYDMYGS